MSQHLGIAMGALIAVAASVNLFATPGSALADQPGQPVPYAGDPQPDSSYRTPPPPPTASQSLAPTTPPAPRSPYNAGDGPRLTEPDDGPDYRAPRTQQRTEPRTDYHAPSSERCRMVEDRVFLPDGTTESSTVEACRDPRGRWHVAD